MKKIVVLLILIMQILAAAAPATASEQNVSPLAKQAQDAYEHVRWTKSDYDAKVLFELASRGAKQNDSECIRLLGLCYYYGYNVKPDDSMALAKFREAYNLGNLQSITNIGSCYLFGEGDAKDEATALKWFREGADKGVASSMASIGYMYDHGLGGLDVNMSEAYEWFIKAAENGDEIAMRNVGRMSFEEHKHIDGYFNDAISWLKKAVDNGYLPAMVDLGDVYSYFEGYPGEVTRFDIAGQWYMQAANAGIVDGMTRMAWMYINGAKNYLPKDFSQAEVWAKKAVAADPKNATAYFQLGYIYYNGDDNIEKDYVKARKYLQKGADLGNESAAYYLEKINGKNK